MKVVQLGHIRKFIASVSEKKSRLKNSIYFSPDKKGFSVYQAYNLFQKKYTLTK